MPRKRMVLTAISTVMILVLAACGNGNGIPSGFDELYSEREGDLHITAYSGSASVEDAFDDFSAWAEGEGWESTGDYGFAGYAGRVFEQDDELLVLNVIDAGAMTSVSVITGPRDADEMPGAGNGNGVPEPTPDQEVEGRDPDLPLYPGAIRVSYFEVGDDSAIVSYVVDAPLDDVVAFYQQEFADWDDVNAWEGAHGDGQFTFENLEDDAGFIMTLDSENDDTTTVDIIANMPLFD